jgi:hypothetical protein
LVPDAEYLFRPIADKAMDILNRLGAEAFVKKRMNAEGGGELPQTWPTPWRSRTYSGSSMRCIAFLLLVAITSTWSSLVRAEPTSLQSLQGEWHQLASNAGECADCRVVVERNGPDFTVKASNGWSAIVRPSFQERASVAGKGSWQPNFGGVYGGKAFYLNLGIVGDTLLMIMTVPGPNGGLRNIKATFEKRPASGEAL